MTDYRSQRHRHATTVRSRGRRWNVPWARNGRDVRAAYLTPLIVLGIFGIVAEATGGAPAAYLVALVAMLFTALSYGRMAAAYPVAGSAYTYVRRTIDPRARLPGGLGDPARLPLPAHGHLADRRRLPVRPVPRRPDGCGSSASSSSPPC